jgi:hypothetical protein
MDATSLIFKTIDKLKTRSPDFFYSHGAVRQVPDDSYSAWHLHETMPPEHSQFLGIRRLYLQDCTRLKSLDCLEGFPNLETLWIYGSDKLANIEGVQFNNKLKSLTIWPSFSAQIIVDSLKPVAALNELGELYFSGKTRDGSLDQVGSLAHLKNVFFSNAYSWEEIARFEARHPKAEFPWKGGVVYDANPKVLKCKECGRPQAMLSGKGLRLTCPKCNEAYLRKHVARYQKISVG